MANPTTNYGWVMPAATDLVTDLPADFDVFGQAVDTDFVGLLGGTTGQVLAKASGTDLDFVWSADAAGMTNPMTTTADIIYSSSGSTPARLGIGSAADVLTVAGGVPTWAAPASAGKVLQVVQDTDTSSFSTASTTFQDTGLSVTITPSLATSKVLITVAGLRGYIINTGTQTSAFATFRLVRTSTALQNVTGGSAKLASTSSPDTYFYPSFGYLDSPATTSATTYKIQGQCESTASTTCAYSASATQIVSIIAYEIGA